MVRQYRGAGEGYRSGQSVVNIFLLWIHFSIEALCLVEYGVYLFTAKSEDSTGKRFFCG